MLHKLGCMHWQRMAEHTVIIQDVAEESDCDRVMVSLLVIDVVIGRLGSDSCECRPKLLSDLASSPALTSAGDEAISDSVDLTQKREIGQNSVFWCYSDMSFCIVMPFQLSSFLSIIGYFNQHCCKSL